MRQELIDGTTPAGLLCDSTQRIPTLDRPELEAWRDWPGPRCSPKAILGEGLAAAAAWQCVLAAQALQDGKAAQALISISGCNQQAIGARLRAINRADRSD
jgi:hypothetical protein